MAPKWITVLFLHFPKKTHLWLLATLGLNEMGKFLYEGNLKSGLDNLPLFLQRISVKLPFFLQKAKRFRHYFGLGYDFGRREFRI